MSKVFRYKNGYKGVVSDAVAVILEKKGEGKSLGEPAPAPEKADDKKKAAEK